MTPGKGSKYREFYAQSGRITCMAKTKRGVNISSKTKITANLQRKALDQLSSIYKIPKIAIIVFKLWCQEATNLCPNREVKSSKCSGESGDAFAEILASRDLQNCVSARPLHIFKWTCWGIVSAG